MPIRRAVDRYGRPTTTKPILYVLQARSIREGWPPVDLGDLLELRQLRPDNHQWQGFVFEASVFGINRAKGEVVLRCDGLLDWEEQMQFNVIWKVQGTCGLTVLNAGDRLTVFCRPHVFALAAGN